jgi:hypothetical protein
MSTRHAILEHAERLGKMESNPARGVRHLASTPRDCRLSRAEIEKLGKAMRAAEHEGEHPTGLAAIRFLLMTGLRRTEGLALERTWLNEEEGLNPLSRHEEWRANAAHRPRRRGPAAGATADRVALLLPGRLGRGARRQNHDMAEQNQALSANELRRLVDGQDRCRPAGPVGWMRRLRLAFSAGDRDYLLRLRRSVLTFSAWSAENAGLPE